MPHPRKIIKNAVNASSLCMCALRINVIMPPPSPCPLPTLPHPSPPPGIPTHYESTKPFGIPRKPVFPQFFCGFNMRNLANIVGRGGAPTTTTTTTAIIVITIILVVIFSYCYYYYCYYCYYYTLWSVDLLIFPFFAPKEVLRPFSFWRTI